MKLDLKEWIKHSTIKTKTVTGTTDANGYVSLGLGIDIIPLWTSRVTFNNVVHAGQTRPCFLLDNYNSRTTVRFKSWDDAVLFASGSISFKVYYLVVGGVVRKLLKALKPLTLGRGWAA